MQTWSRRNWKRRRRRRRMRRTALIKSNNPHLAGGEKHLGVQGNDPSLSLWETSRRLVRYYPKKLTCKYLGAPGTSNGNSQTRQCLMSLRVRRWCPCSSKSVLSHFQTNSNGCSPHRIQLPRSSPSPALGSTQTGSRGKLGHNRCPRQYTPCPAHFPACKALFCFFTVRCCSGPPVVRLAQSIGFWFVRASVYVASSWA